MLKNNFNRLPLKQKVLLYFIVTISFTIAFILAQNYILSLQTPKKIEKKYYTIQSLENKISVQSSESILKYIESKIDKSNIFIESIQTNNQTIFLKIDDTFYKTIKLLYSLEQHLIIEEILLEKETSNNAKIKCKVRFANRYLINKTQSYHLPTKIINPFFSPKKTVAKEKIVKKATSKQQLIIVDAIVNSEVFIGENWYKKGDVFDNYKIIAIKQTFIKLLNQKTKMIKIIKVNNEER